MFVSFAAPPPGPPGPGPVGPPGAVGGPGGMVMAPAGGSHLPSAPPDLPSEYACKAS